MRAACTALAAALVIAGTAQAAPACRARPGDAEQVQKTVHAFYAALAGDDAAGVGRVTAPDFYAYDVGKRFNTAAELADTVKRTHAQGIVLEWNLGPIDAHVGCDQAWAAWENDGHVGPRNALGPMHWLESAVLRRQGPGWVIVFLHSTRVPPAK